MLQPSLRSRYHPAARKSFRRNASRGSGNGMWASMAMVLVAFISGGATCARRQTIGEFAPPVVFEAQPELADIIQQVNRSLALERLESGTLTITSPDVSAKLHGNLKWERPYNFNLQAYYGNRVLGTVLAAGSNSEMFWLQTQRPSPPTIYYARRDEFENQLGPRRILPVSPLWLREALGVIEMDPSLPHDGPFTRADGRLEVRSYIPSPRGSYRRHLVLDAETGAIEQTLLYDHLGKLVASAQQSEHQYFAAIDTNLPHKIDIQLQPDDGPLLAFTIEVGFYLVNEASGAEAGAFDPPDPTGLSKVNLVDANRSAEQAVPAPPGYTQTQPVHRQSKLTQPRANHFRANNAWGQTPGLLR